MSGRVVLLRGDGLGEELLPHARHVLEALAPDLELVEAELGYGTFRRRRTALPAETLEAARSADACLLIAVGSPLGPVEGYASPIVLLRRELALFANVRPVRSLPPGCPARAPWTPEVDLVIVRENTEGLYSGRERTGPGWAVTERVVTEAASRRIARFAGELAARQGRRRVTVVHKSNVLRASCGLFRACALDELARFPGLEIDELLVDTAAHRLAAHPEQLDVLVTTNLFGDVLSDLAAHFGGGLGLAESANVGQHGALFEPVHGSAPDIAGRNVANPLATFRALASLLEHLGEAARRAAAQRLRAALEELLVHGPWTRDLGGEATTDQITEAVLQAVAPEPATVPSL